ncbi:hypothetical protein Emtol_3281 [Emticicia oligotrophica DSM 17448]|uniref:DUF4249 domain-containing protein n=1 Tax=Emticicia oligotrophica (strain DSM 17448 / CIP 109782 / MTCC 6937 / GPTSA100-15) TaxID=929562 RepID=A0ABN4API4_EMTOG|nr:hypothetical protein Emtol_3281 [Emticicia oligotrophica DSM 17448]
MLLSIALGLWVCSCVEPFNLNIKSDLRILTVDATITDTAEEQTITITESVNSNGSAYSQPVLKATAELIVEGAQKIAFTEKGQGVYALPSSFKLQTGVNYKLVFTKQDGTKYESEQDQVTKVPEIIGMHDEFKVQGIEIGENYYQPANYIYLDTQDPANDKNNYLWSWKLWERQNVCATCYNGRYFLTPAPARCREERNYAGQMFDYMCPGDCWDILNNKDLLVFTDIYSNGQPITNKLIAKIPYYNYTGALIEVKQQSISPAAYRYFKLLADQVQNNGSLVDTPPAALIGNVKNVSNPNEAIAGFFMVTSVRTVKYWIDRKSAQGLNINPIGLLDHPLTPEPMGNDLTRPPFAACILGLNRTPNKPNGWIN